jgi:hypothetical protein
MKLQVNHQKVHLASLSTPTLFRSCSEGRIQKILNIIDNSAPLCLTISRNSQVENGNNLPVRLPTSLFYIERDPHSRMEKGEKYTQVQVRVNEATVAWPEATACHRPRRLSGVYRT